MPFNGSGLFTPDGANFPAVSGTKILASKFNNIINEVSTGLSTCVTKDGQTTITANLPMSGFRHTGVGNGTARTDYASVAQVQDGAPTWLGSVSGTSTITATATPSPGAYAAGQMFRFLPVGLNTGACTLNINSLGAKNIHSVSGTALRGGELMSGAVVSVVYDGTQFLLLGAADRRSENVVVNFDLSFWQRGTSFVAAAHTDMFADGWKYLKGGTAAVHTIARSTDVPTLAQAGELFPYSAQFTITTPDTSIAAGDLCGFYQVMEPPVFYRLWQRPMTASFWVKATTTGTYCLFITNAVDRSVPVEFTISSSDTWEQKVVSIPASPSTGTWTLTPGGNTLVQVGICLAAGSTYQGSNGVWSSTAFPYTTASQVNGVNTGSTNFRFTGLRLWDASGSGLILPRNYNEDFALARRRVQSTFPLGTAPSQNSGLAGRRWSQLMGATSTDQHPIMLAEPMFNAGSITFYSPLNASAQTWNRTRSAAMTGTGVFGTLTDYGFTIEGTTTGTSATNDELEVHWVVTGA